MNQSQNTYQDDELTIKDLILKLQSFWKILWGNKLGLFLMALFVGVVFMLSTIGAQKRYNAELSFMLNESERADIGLGAMLGQFGLGAVSGESNYDKILELSKTRKIIQNSIFNKCTVNGSLDYIANHLINNLDSLGLWQVKKWYNFSESNPKLDIKDFRFTHDSIEVFSVKENKALKAVYKHIVGADKIKGMMSSGYDESSGIMRTQVISTEPELSVNLSKMVFDNLSEYYVNKTVEKQKQTFDIIKNKADSIYSALSGAETELAKFRDSNRGLFNNRDKLREASLMREIQKLNIMYSEAAKNKELAEFTLQNKTPYIQIIDEPILPIKGRKKSKFKYFIIGAILGGFIMASYLIGKAIYADIMK